MDRGIKRQWRAGTVCAVAAVGLLLLGSHLRPYVQADLALTNPCIDNIVVVPIQVGRDSYGIAMVDTAGKRLWVYEINSRVTRNRLKLLAARDFQYDQLLDDYNTGEPKPEQVKEILDKLRDYRQPQPRDDEKLEEMAQPEEN